jgi:hypothetical protein
VAEPNSRKLHAQMDRKISSNAKKEARDVGISWVPKAFAGDSKFRCFKCPVNCNYSWPTANICRIQQLLSDPIEAKIDQNTMISLLSPMLRLIDFIGSWRVS